MDKVLTAEQYLINNGLTYLSQEETSSRVYWMKQFAQLHVKAALEAAANTAKIDCPRYSDMICKCDKKTILESYPLTNIK